MRAGTWLACLVGASLHASLVAGLAVPHGLGGSNAAGGGDASEAEALKHIHASLEDIGAWGGGSGGGGGGGSGDADSDEADAWVAADAQRRHFAARRERSGAAHLASQHQLEEEHRRHAHMTRKAKLKLKLKQQKLLRLQARLKSRLRQDSDAVSNVALAAYGGRDDAAAAARTAEALATAASADAASIAALADADAASAAPNLPTDKDKDKDKAKAKAATAGGANDNIDMAAFARAQRREKMIAASAAARQFSLLQAEASIAAEQAKLAARVSGRWRPQHTDICPDVNAGGGGAGAGGGDGNEPGRSESGYITVGKQRKKHMFYWFYEARHPAADTPLMFYLNGGPGCSSLFSILRENGPCKVNKDGVSLRRNAYSWTEAAHMLWIDQPVGVGFSYADPADDGEVIIDRNEWELRDDMYVVHALTHSLTSLTRRSARARFSRLSGAFHASSYL